MMDEGSGLIEQGSVVTLQYRLFDSQGEALEPGERTIVYRHGAVGEIFEEIEQALAGKRVGEEVSIYLEPERTFGEYDASLIRLAPRKKFPETLEQGMSFEGLPGEPADGRIWTVTGISTESVVLDANHPLAGMALRFDVRVLEVDNDPRDDLQEADEDQPPESPESSSRIARSE